MDKDAFTEAVLAAEGTLYRIAKSILREEADCADAVQEAILKAYISLGRLRETRYFKTWLCRILIRECYKCCRKREKLVPLAEIGELAVAVQEEDASALYESIMALDKRLRPVVVMHYIEGFSTQEIAAALGIPQGTVKSRLSRARKQLKEEVLEEEALRYE